MTPEQADKLRDGDRVLIEAEISCTDKNASTLAKRTGTVSVSIKSYRGIENIYHVHYLAVREKITPPRRMFRKGDIVKHKDSYSLSLFYVAACELAGSSSVCLTTGNSFTEAPASELELICAVEDRVDGKEEV